MFDVVSPLLSGSNECCMAIAARLTFPALLGLLVVGLEAWLRMPLSPLVDFYLPKAHAWSESVIRRISF